MPRPDTTPTETVTLAPMTREAAETLLRRFPTEGVDAGLAPDQIEFRNLLRAALDGEVPGRDIMFRADLRNFCEAGITQADAERRETSVIEPYERATGMVDAFNHVLGHFDLLDDSDSSSESPRGEGQ